MSGAGRGVTPGAESEAGSGESATPPVHDQGQPVTPDSEPAAKADASPDDGTDPTTSEAESAGSGTGGSGTGGRRPVGRRTRRRRSFWREFPILVVIALLLAVVIKTFAIQAFFIPSGSMENTLEINDRVLVNKLVYDVRSIHRGDIVVFNGDGSWDPGTVPVSTNFAVKFADGFASMFGFGHPGDILIKRVIGLPGDHVACCGSWETTGLSPTTPEITKAIPVAEQYRKARSSAGPSSSSGRPAGGGSCRFPLPSSGRN
jgi:signal peptidase I